VKLSQLEPDLAAGCADGAPTVTATASDLPGAVRSDNGDSIAAVDTQADRIDQRAPATASRPIVPSITAVIVRPGPRCAAAWTRKNGRGRRCGQDPTHLGGRDDGGGPRVSAPTEARRRASRGRQQGDSNKPMRGSDHQPQQSAHHRLRQIRQAADRDDTPVHRETNTIEMRLTFDVDAPL